jgi:hypothetical protein
LTATLASALLIDTLTHQHASDHGAASSDNSGVAHPDLDRLLDFSLRFAQDLLKRRGAFFPFAATVGATGELKPLAVHSDEERPDPKKLLDETTEVLKGLARSGKVTATALCYDSTVAVKGTAKSKQDAIAVALEHASGEAAVVYLPYKKIKGGFSYGETIGVKGEGRVFGQG